MHDALQGLKEVAFIYDDVLVYGSGSTMAAAQADHNTDMVALLNRCHEKSIRLSVEKLQLNPPRTVFIEYELKAVDLHPDHRKVAAIQQRSVPIDCPGFCVFSV